MDSMKMVRPPEADFRAVRGEVTGGLIAALADTYRLLFKTHACQWNVEGRLFHGVHTLAEAHATDLFAAAGLLAGRIRALGRFTPMALSDITALSSLRDAGRPLSVPDWLDDLARDHATLSRRMQALAALARGQDDPVTVELATARIGFHDKAGWMLQALAR